MTTTGKTRPRAFRPAPAVFAALFLLAGCRSDDPAIVSIYPTTGVPGDVLTILGSSFGGERGTSYVTIGGGQPMGTAYVEWRDDRILVRVPELGDAGLVFVHVGGRRSNGVLFANRNALPRMAPGERTGLGPVISSVTPQAAPVGSLVTITGSGFGGSRGTGGVFFSRASPGGAWGGERDFVKVSEADFGYDLWTDREIRVRVPHGAADGTVEVRTARGGSPPLPFEVSGGPGTKTFGERRGYVVTYSVNVRAETAEAPNTLHLWVPAPLVSAAQRNAEMIFSAPEPFIRDYFGTSLYRLENLRAGVGADVNLSWMVDVFEVRTSVNPQAVRREAVSPIRDAHTGSCSWLPADDPRVRALAASVLGGETNPYLQARRVYDWMLGGGIEWEERSAGDVFSAIESGRADPFLGALLFSTLLRAAGVPSQPVAGVLVGRDLRTASHHWAEFWIDGLGWIPADPAMGASMSAAAENRGAGPVPEAFFPAPVFAEPDEYYNDGETPEAAPKDWAAFFFGNMDNRRIAFSRGVTNLSQMDPRGRTVTHVRSFALQTLWEEASGGLAAYSSLWGDVIIAGMHAQ